MLELLPSEDLDELRERGVQEIKFYDSGHVASVTFFTAEKREVQPNEGDMKEAFVDKGVEEIMSILDKTADSDTWAYIKEDILFEVNKIMKKKREELLYHSS